MFSFLKNNNIYLGIGDWGLGIPIPNPQRELFLYQILIYNYLIKIKKILKNK